MRSLQEYYLARGTGRRPRPARPGLRNSPRPAPAAWQSFRRAGRRADTRRANPPRFRSPSPTRRVLSADACTAPVVHILPRPARRRHRCRHARRPLGSPATPARQRWSGWRPARRPCAASPQARGGASRRWSRPDSLGRRGAGCWPAAATAFAAAAAPSLVAALEAAGVLDDDAPRPRRRSVSTGRSPPTPSSTGPSVLLRLAVTQAAVGPCACPLPVRRRRARGRRPAAWPRRASPQWRAGRQVAVWPRVRRPVTLPQSRRRRCRRTTWCAGGWPSPASVKSALLVERVAPGTVAGGGGGGDPRPGPRGRSPAPPATTGRGRGDRHGGARRRSRRPRCRAHRAAAARRDVPRDRHLRRQHRPAQRAGRCGASARLLGAGRLALALTAAVLVAYAFVVGGGASVLRATGMAVVGLAARSLDQQGIALNVLALTGAALLVADPLLAADTGFWLTTAATAGLVVGLGDAGGRRRYWCAARPGAGAHLGVGGTRAAADRRRGLPAGDPGRRAAQRDRDPGHGDGADGGRWRRSPPTSRRRGLLAPAGVALRAGAALVTESARVVDVAAVAQLAGAAAAPGRRRRLLRGARRCGCGRACRDAADVRGRGCVPARLSAVAVLAVVDCGGAGQPRGWRQRPTSSSPTLDVGQGDAIVHSLPERRDDAGRCRRAIAGSRFDVGARVVGPALRAPRHPAARLPGRHPRRCRSHRRRARAWWRSSRRREVWTGVPVAGDAATAALAPRPPTRRAPPGARVQRGDRLGDRRGRGRACCTRRRPTGSASGCATTTRWCWR